jgi:hypothetical protein
LINVGMELLSQVLISKMFGSLAASINRVH